MNYNKNVASISIYPPRSAFNLMSLGQTHFYCNGLNTAFFLSEIGYQVTVTGLIDIMNSTGMEACFKIREIDNSLIRTAGPIPSRSEIEKLYDIIAEMCRTHDWFILSGNIPGGLKIDIFTDIIYIIKSMDRTVIFDISGETSHRPVLVSPDIMKPNLKTLEGHYNRTFNGHEEILEIIDDLISKGCNTVVVPLKEKGVLFADKNGAVMAYASQHDMQGWFVSEEAMVAGIISSKRRGLSLPETAKFATSFYICGPNLAGCSDSLKDKVKVFSEKIMIKTIK